MWYCAEQHDIYLGQSDRRHRRWRRFCRKSNNYRNYCSVSSTSSSLGRSICHIWGSAHIIHLNDKVSSVIGPILGGVFTDKLTWRWCFYINLPLGAITILGIVLLFNTPSNRTPTNQTIKERLSELDYIGPVFFIPANICLLLALQWGGSAYPWSSSIIVGLFSGFGVLAPIWLYTQYRLKERATIPFRILTQRTVLYSSLFGCVASASLIILLFYIPFYFQAIRDTSATTSGVDTIPMVAGIMVPSLTSGVLISKVGYYTPFMIVGEILLAVGAGLLGTLRLGTTVPQWVIYQVVAGLGAGLNIQVSKRDTTHS